MYTHITCRDTQIGDRAQIVMEIVMSMDTCQRCRASFINIVAYTENYV